MIPCEGPDGGLLAIARPAHAALAGRLAQAWDDELPPALAPERVPVVLAAPD